MLGSLDQYTFEQNKRLQSVLERSERIASAYDEALKKFKAVKAADDADTRRTAIIIIIIIIIIILLLLLLLRSSFTQSKQ